MMSNHFRQKREPETDVGCLALSLYVIGAVLLGFLAVALITYPWGTL